ncbi:MAG TPA: phosphate signaling complex protein PhoU [Acidimicrobiales bacterium]|nr:phosphate signaling complex protein PhoU [Acidimicrobiales bacterium]
MTSRVAFQEALGTLRADVDWLGALAEEAVRGAVGALVGDDGTKAELVIAGDDDLDRLFVALEERAYQLMARQAPVAADLRFLVSSLRVMADYERTGDLAVAIAKLARVDWARESTSLVLLGQMADIALDLVASARRAWRDEDLELAGALERRDDALDACFRRLAAHLLAQDGPEASGLVFHALLAGRHLERIADHAVAVGDRVVYMITGDPSYLAAEIG